jgi:hypothetical protein
MTNHEPIVEVFGVNNSMNQCYSPRVEHFIEETLQNCEQKILHHSEEARKSARRRMLVVTPSIIIPSLCIPLLETLHSYDIVIHAIVALLALSATSAVAESVCGFGAEEQAHRQAAVELRKLKNELDFLMVQEPENRPNAPAKMAELRQRLEAIVAQSPL